MQDEDGGILLTSPLAHAQFYQADAEKLVREMETERRKAEAMKRGIALESLNVTTLLPKEREKEIERVTRSVERTGLVMGYNCKQPLNVRAVSSPLPGDDCAYAHRLNDSLTRRHSRGFLLQREKYRRYQATKVQIMKTTLSWECGEKDHISLYPLFDQISLPLLPTHAQVIEIKERGTFTHGDHIEQQKIQYGGWTNFNYLEAGSIHLSHYFPYGAPEVHCAGGKVEFKNPDNQDQYSEDIVRWVNMRVGWFTVNVLEDIETGRVTIEEGGETFDEDKCYGSDKDFCKTSEASYYRHRGSLKNFCPLAQVKIVTGSILSTTEGQKVFMSDDDSLVRLVLNEKVPECGELVYRTNHPGLYFFPRTTGLNEPFKRKLHYREQRFSTYVTTRDDYIYHHLVAEIEKEMNKLLYADCAARGQRRRTNFFLQHNSPGFTNFFLSNGTFATASGEVVYHYECVRQLFLPAITEKCYDALPVVFYIDGETVTADQFITGPPEHFIEPLTRRLVTNATTVPCSTTFPPIYMDTTGQWFKSMGGNRTDMEQPQVAAKEELRRIQLNKILDTATGGLYDIEELRRMEDFQMMPRKRASMTYQLTHQSSISNGKGYLTPRDLFPQTNAWGWFTGVLGTLLSFLETYGNICAVIFSVVIIYGWIQRLITWVYGLTQIGQRHGCSRYLCYACCPQVFFFRWYNHGPPSSYTSRKYKPNSAQENDYDDLPPPPEGLGRVVSSPPAEEMVALTRHRRAQPPPPPPRVSSTSSFQSSSSSSAAAGDIDICAASEEMPSREERPSRRFPMTSTLRKALRMSSKQRLSGYVPPSIQRRHPSMSSIQEDAESGAELLAPTAPVQPVGHQHEEEAGEKQKESTTI